MSTAYYRLRPYRAVLTAEFAVQKGRYGLALFGHVAEPLADIGVLVLWHYAMRVLPVYGTSIVLFISSGIYPMFLFVHMSSQLMNATRENRFLFRGIENIHLMTAKISVALMTFILVGVVLFSAEYAYISPLALPFQPLSVVASAFSLLALGIGMALINAVLVVVLPVWRFVWGGLARMSILFAGCLYVPDWLPPYLRDKIQWNPVLQGVSLFRQGFYPGYPQLIFRPWYLFLWSVGLLMIGLCLERTTRKMVGYRKTIMAT